MTAACLRVVMVIVERRVFDAVVLEGDDALCERLACAEWAHADGGDYTCSMADRAAVLVRASLAGIDGWREEDITAEYVVGRTRDAARVDGFSTMELAGAEADGWRTVATRPEDLDWQIERYDDWKPVVASAVATT